MKLFVRSKKGSLSLSMEAIVILILAVVMLGLALAFIQGMFKNLKDRATNTLDLADYDLNPTEDKPIMFSPSNPTVKEGEPVELAVGFYNSHPSADYWKMIIIDDQQLQCAGLTTGDTYCYNQIETIYSDSPVSIEKDNTNGWQLSFTPEQGSNNGESLKSYLFTIKFCGVDAANSATGSGGNTQPTIDCNDAATVTKQRQLFLKVRR